VVLLAVVLPGGSDPVVIHMIYLSPATGVDPGVCNYLCSVDDSLAQNNWSTVTVQGVDHHR